MAKKKIDPINEKQYGAVADASKPFGTTRSGESLVGDRILQRGTSQ
jgi:hypothetical protein